MPNKKNYTKVYKGQMSDKEEYGAFSGEEGEKLLGRYKDCEIVVCGLAGNFCVLSTLKNILTWIDKSQVKVFIIPTNEELMIAKQTEKIVK